MIAGISAVFLLFFELPFLAGLLLVAIALGCIVSIVKAREGMQEVKDSRGKQWGTGLSVLAILGAILGLLISALMLGVVFDS